jgi:hypothetical protein
MPMTEDAKRTSPLPMESLFGVPFMHFRHHLYANLPIVICIGLVILPLQSAFIMAQAAEPPGIAPNTATLPFTTEPFYPLPLKAYYQRSLASYTARDAWGAVPRGLQRFDGIPFQMDGKIELNGMGPTRDNNFMPTRVGEIPVNRHVLRLHWIGGAGYKDPDDTPIAEIRLNYKNGEIRHLFITYGRHVRNWHVEVDEKRTDLSDPKAHVIWEGINGSTGRPVRLFKNTFDNPLPEQEIQSLQFLSMFGKAFFALCAVTLEEGKSTLAAVEDFDDSPYRRESLVRVLDADTGAAISNAVLRLAVTEGDKAFGFGIYRSDAHGQILLDYPPGRFVQIQFGLAAPQYVPLRETQSNEDGLLPIELKLRCKRSSERP